MDDVAGPFALLEWGMPLGIAFCHNSDAKAELTERMRTLARPRETCVVRSGEEALLHIGKNALILVDPANESAAVSYFDRNCDHFENVKTCTLLLLLRGGDGEVALRHAPCLVSFALHASFEVLPDRSYVDARAAFTALHGLEPEEWLKRWRCGIFPDTLENNYALSDAIAYKNAKEDEK